MKWHIWETNNKSFSEKQEKLINFMVCEAIRGGRL